MSNLKFVHKVDGSLTIVLNGSMHTVNKGDINYDAVLANLKSGDAEAVSKLINIKKFIAEHTDGRVEFSKDEVFIDKKPLPEAVGKRLFDVLRKNRMDLSPVCRLLENIEANPAEFSRNEIYLFLDHNKLPITEDGCFYAYKMVKANYNDIYTNSISHAVGTKPSMPREEVDPNRHNTCSQGFHFCSHSYLSHAYCVGDKTNRLMIVKVNPADVVSIPSDYNNAKGRCWTYEVVGELPHYGDSLPQNFTRINFGPDVCTSDMDRAEAEAQWKAWPDEQVQGSNDLVDDQDEQDDGVSSVTVSISSSGTVTVTGDVNIYSQKLDAVKVREIRKMLQDEWTLAGIAKHFGISARQVARIRDGESWADA
jgi:hypothetical protein